VLNYDIHEHVSDEHNQIMVQMLCTLYRAPTLVLDEPKNMIQMNTEVHQSMFHVPHNFTWLGDRQESPEIHSRLESMSSDGLLHSSTVC